MEVKCKETAFDCYRVVYDQDLRREESIDSVVPDTLPDIGVILSTCGAPLIRSKDLSEGLIRVEANVPAKIAYQAEEGEGIYTLDINIPISVSQESAEITEKCLCTADLRILALETKVLNPRKVTVRAELCFSLQCACVTNICFFGAPEEKESGIQVQEKELNLTPVCALAEKTFVLTDEFMLPSGKPELAQVISQKTALETDEMKTVGTKIILKGCAKSSIVYLSPEGTPAAVEFSTGFSQIVEAEKLVENAYLSAKLLLSGAYYDVSSDAEGRIIGMELHLVAQVTVYGRGKAVYLADAYSNLYTLSLQIETEEVSTICRNITLRETLRESLELPVPAAEVLSADAVCGCASVSGGEVTLPVTMLIFYKCSAGLLHFAKRSYSMRVQAELAAGERLYVANTVLQELYAVPAGNSIELRLPAEISVFVFEDRTVEAVGEISFDEEKPLDLSGEPTLVLLRADGEMDLWTLAKENHSTVLAITEANALESSPLPEDRLLLIPKTLF